MCRGSLMVYRSYSGGCVGRVSPDKVQIALCKVPIASGLKVSGGRIIIIRDLPAGEFAMRAPSAANHRQRAHHR